MALAARRSPLRRLTLRYQQQAGLLGTLAVQPRRSQAPACCRSASYPLPRLPARIWQIEKPGQHLVMLGPQQVRRGPGQFFGVGEAHAEGQPLRAIVSVSEGRQLSVVRGTATCSPSDQVLSRCRRHLHLPGSKLLLTQFSSRPSRKRARCGAARCISSGRVECRCRCRQQAMADRCRFLPCAISRRCALAGSSSGLRPGQPPAPCVLGVVQHR